MSSSSGTTNSVTSHLPSRGAQRRGTSCSHVVAAAVRVVTGLLVLIGAAQAGDAARLIELTDGATTWTGRIMARDSESCFVMDRSGVMVQVGIPELQSFKVVAETYQPYSVNEFRRQLLTEFPQGYEVQSSGSFIVCAEKGTARAFARKFDETREQVTSFYRIRGFDTPDLDVPLVAIVLRSRDELQAYCERDGMAWSDTLRGYYSLKTNRVVLYDTSVPARPAANHLEPDRAVTGDDPWPGSPFDREPEYFSGVPMSHERFARGARGGDVALAFAIDAETADTIVHETTHQVTFNLGIHSRIGETPMWLLEGLATTLEAPGLRTRDKSPGSSVNRERLDWFLTEASQRRVRGSLAQLIASDDQFRDRTLDAYSEAWALAFFLSENPARARQFMKYVRLVADRSPFEPYTAELRLKDFQAVFGNDLAKLEVDLLRRIDAVATE